jgi:DNA-binding Xre family transcriptional regulator
MARIYTGHRHGHGRRTIRPPRQAARALRRITAAFPDPCDKRAIRGPAQIAAVDDLRVGNALRVIRVRRRLRQKDIAALAQVSPTIVTRIEHGRLANVSVGTIRRVAQALDARVDLFVRWQGGDLGRLIYARHAAHA